MPLNPDSVQGQQNINFSVHSSFAAVAVERERLLDISLPGLARGYDSSNRKYEERIQVKSMSSEKAIFVIKAHLDIGSRVSLEVEIPQTLILEKALLLTVTGHVTMIELDKKHRDSKIVTILLEKSYTLNPII